MSTTCLRSTHYARPWWVAAGLAAALATAGGAASAQTTAPPSSAGDRVSAGTPASAPARMARVEEAASLIGDAELVVFGESSHWDYGVHAFVNRLFRHLVEHKGFRVFVLESAWGVDEVTRDMIASGRTELGPTESFFLNAFGSPSTVETIAWVREWNSKHPTDPVRFAGYQPEQPVRDFQALWAYLARSPAFEAAGLQAATAVCGAGSGEFKTELDFLGPMMKARRAGRPGMPTADRLACVDGLGAIERFLTANHEALVAATSQGAFTEAGVHLTSLRGFYEHILRVADASADKTLTPEQTAALGKEAYQNGDRVRFEIFQGLRETRYRGQKMLLWMHNWHAARASEEIAEAKGVGIPKGTTSLGARLARAYGDRLITFGSVVPCPRCTSASPTGIAERFREVLGEGSAIVDLRRPAAGLARLPLSTLGTLIEPLNDGAFVDVVLSRQFDALYYQSASDTILDRRAQAQKK
ncbi:MAG: erythromycin esterase family protein [Chloroflexi bacterium]|nr:erythromycin esterase family protein [Chloroflexota bacterium]